jgi:hypothetical protein
MNREQELNKTFPLEDGTTYIQSLDNFMCEYSGLPSPQSYDKSNEPKGAGVGGESIKENFIDSAPSSSNSDADEKLNTIYEKLDRDYMYNWIKGHKNK